MRVLFAGSPAIAVPSLKILCGESCRKEGIVPVGVLTNPDAARGRKSTLLPTEVAEEAASILQKREGEIFPILKPLKLDTAFREEVALLKPDILVSFAYGRFFGPKFLGLFPLNGINIHPSLLPKYRGPAPIQAAILNRDAVTGITFQTLANEMDSGDILAQEELQLTGEETTGSLTEIAAQKAASMLAGVLKDIKANKIKGQPQNHSEASYCSLLSKEDSFINWNTGAGDIEARIRAFDPWPLCRTIHNGRELIILKAVVYNGEEDGRGKPGTVLGTDKQAGILMQTGNGIVAVTELQYHAKKALLWRDFLNGARDFTGSMLG